MTHENNGWVSHFAAADADEKKVMLQVILLQLVWMRGELQVQQSDCPIVNL